MTECDPLFSLNVTNFYSENTGIQCGKILGIRLVFGWYLQVFAVLSWVFGVFGSFLGLSFPIFHVCESGGKYPFIILKGGTEGSPRPCPLHSHPTTTQHPHRPEQSSIPLPRIPCPANPLSRILCKASPLLPERHRIAPVPSWQRGVTVCKGKRTLSARSNRKPGLAPDQTRP